MRIKNVLLVCEIFLSLGDSKQIMKEVLKSHHNLS